MFFDIALHKTKKPKIAAQDFFALFALFDVVGVGIVVVVGFGIVYCRPFFNSCILHTYACSYTIFTKTKNKNSHKEGFRTKSNGRTHTHKLMKLFAICFLLHFPFVVLRLVSTTTTSAMHLYVFAMVIATSICSAAARLCVYVIIPQYIRIQLIRLCCALFGMHRRANKTETKKSSNENKQR